MSFNTDKLSYFHSFSKTPVQSGTDFDAGTTLGNAINKSGHTVTASEVWASDIPYYGKMGSLDDVKTKVQPYARKNDMCYITAGADKGKTFQYDGANNWTDITSALVDGAIFKNSKDENVILYHKGINLTNLTAANNANTDSANNAARLWVRRASDGLSLSGDATRLVEQFVAPTDKALNGLASVAYAPTIDNGSLVSGTNYYDYCFSGTILWASAREALTPIDCFEYIGPKVLDIVTTVSNNKSSINSLTDDISEIKDKLGLGDTGDGGTESLGSRVSAVEEAVETVEGRVDDIEATLESGVVATVIHSANASTAGITVSTANKTATVDVAVGAVASNDTKVVTGGAVYSAIDTAKSGLQASIDGKVAQSDYNTKVAALEAGIQEAKTAASDAATAASNAETNANSYTDAEVKKVSDALATAIEDHDADIKTLNDAVETLTTSGFTRIIVTELPSTDIKENAIYLIKNANSEAGEYIEYIYVKELSKFEQIGSTKTDLSGYVTVTVHNELAARVTTAEGEIDTKAAASDVSALTTRVTTAEGKISANETAIATKAAADDVNALTTRVTTAEGKISTLETTVGQHSTSIEDLTKSITDNEADIEAKVSTLSQVVADNKASANATQTDLDALEETVAELNTFISGGTGSGETLADMLAGKVDNVTGGTNGITIMTNSANGQKVATLTVSPSTTVTAGNTSVVTSGAVATAIANAQSVLQGNIDNKVESSTYEAKITEIETALDSKASTENLNGVADRVTTAEQEIDSLQDFVAEGVDAKINAAIEKLDSDKSSAGIQVVQENGVITSLAVTAGTVVSGDTSVITGGAVADAIAAQAAKDAAAYASKATETVAANAQTAASNAQTKADEAYALADAATTVDEATTIAETAAAAVEAKIPTEYIKSITPLHGIGKMNGGDIKVASSSDPITWYNTSALATHNIINRSFGTYSATTINNDNDTLAFDIGGLWNLDTSDAVGKDEYRQMVTIPAIDVHSIINGILYGSTLQTGSWTRFINFEKLASSFNNILPSTLVAFITDMPYLQDGINFFSPCNLLTTFKGNLSSLKTAVSMFANCKLDAESVMYIADGIKDWGSAPSEEHPITIDVAEEYSAEPTIAEYFNELGQKGWTVASNHTAYATTTDIANSDTAVYVIARSCNENNATHTTKDGKFVRLETAKSVVGPHQHLWSIYASEEDAVLDMELAAI